MIPPFTVLLFFRLCVFLIQGISFDVEVQYQDRGNRYEGIRTRQVSGYDIDFISMRADYKEEHTTILPDTFRIAVYLHEATDVFVTVRELDYKQYYWLDKVETTNWSKGFHNNFHWSTNDVIKKLHGLRLYDLGVLTRLKTPEPKQEEWVAPAILYHSKLPKKLNGYVFTFKLKNRSRVRFRMFREGYGSPVDESPSRLENGSRPFSYHWKCNSAPEGAYKLVMDGYFIHSNDPIAKTVLFYHKPGVAD